MKKALETISSLVGSNAELITGANTDPSLFGRVQMTILAVKYDRLAEKPVVSKETARHWGSNLPGLNQIKTSARENLEQGLLELQSYSKGIFSNMAPTKYKDEDLDIPTFQRRNVVIDKGDVGR
jgi:cell division GTPase FtsZ